MELNGVNTGYNLNEYIELQTLYESQFGITATAFDAQQELFWSGSEDGRQSPPELFLKKKLNYS